MSKHKLRLTPPQPEDAKTPSLPKETGYESPIGWWYVTTEGDVEGRSTKQLGTYYGHVAEIALHLADKCFYSLNFRFCTAPSTDDWGTPAKKCRRTYQATRSWTWVRVNADGLENAESMAAWLNTDDVQVKQRTANATYYKSVVLHLPGAAPK